MTEYNPEDEQKNVQESDEEQTDGDGPEAPVAVEPAPVEVSPSETPTVTRLDKEYEVTPERGHRLKR